MRHISKQYPGVRALDDVSLTVYEGEVHALLGENGAGKSTLMKILAGAETKDSGEILLSGQRVHIDSPQKAMSLGISIIYQEFNLVPYLSAGENIFLGREPRALLPGFVDFRTLYRRSQEVLDRLGVRLDARAPVYRLSVAQQQMVEIAKATSKQARIIIMDEPSATLTEHELQALFNLIRQLKANGVSIVYISHRLEEVFEICDRATIMRDGRVIATEPVANLTRAQIIRLMVGRELKEAIPKVAAETGAACSTTSPSRSARAKFWALPAWSAREGRRRPAPSSAPIPSTAARSRCSASRSASAHRRMPFITASAW